MIVKKNKKVFVGMSGGVDSSVAAALLKNKGYDVVGVFIKSYNLDGCAEQDADDARRVAEQLKIPFYVFDLEKEYKEKVVKYMIDGYKEGITPNPDVMCNKEIKFGLFLKRVLELGADYVATGHYVRLVERTNDYFYRHRVSVFSSEKQHRLSLGTKNPIRQLADSDTKLFVPPRHALRNNRQFVLLTAVDLNKDQSYFLWTLTQNQLQYCLFPIGEYTKPRVRKLAKKFGLITTEKKDSQGICFLGKVSLTQFLEGYLPKKRGMVLNISGEKIGEHRGAHFYTIGQRSGLGIGGSAKPMYIAEKNIKTNTITLAEGDTNPALYKKEVELVNVNFINNIRTSHVHIFARVRYRQSLSRAKLIYNHKSKIYNLIFDRPQKFIAAGQSAVFYSGIGPAFATPSLKASEAQSKASAGREMLGGGVIV